ncbi:hypothetical protein AURDEDRAFT_163366 [Auricularia subglabra TFB-10046 SS5]|nr:hypothetical protein AURDEDRAFT_163366 [Auricularia subglabra TFB-10046 SS5]
MDLHAADCQLPVELLSLAFDSLCFRDLLEASRVSNFWRTVAFRHPLFWRNIELTSLATPALDLFHARLDASFNQTISIYLSLSEVQFPTRLRSVVLPAIARSLHRLDALYFKIDIAYDTDVFEFLVTPAPRLITFDIYLIHETRSSNVLPVALFAGDAPKLRNLQLQNVRLSAERLPTAFSTIEVLRYGCRGQQSFPTAVFAHCKALRELSIWGTRCTLVDAQDQHCMHRAAKLITLDMAIFSGCRALVQRMPCASILHVSVPLVDVVSALLLLEHLEGRLEVDLSCTSEELFLQYTSLTTNMSRAFVCNLDQLVSGYIPATYTCDDIPSRIECIRASSDTINLLTTFVYLPSCVRAAFRLTEGCPLKAPTMPLYAKELQEICISSPVEATMTVAELELFLNSTFSPIPRAVRVILDGVALDGNIGTISTDRYVVSVGKRAIATGSTNVLVGHGVAD